MRLLLGLAALLTSCAIPAYSAPSLQQGSDVAKALTAATPKLKVIDLPAGDVGSISIGWGNDGTQTKYDQKTWLSEGYEGVLFKGAGIDKTHVRCTGWGATIGVTRHDGIVQFEDMTIHAGHNAALTLGEQNTAKTVSPKFRANLTRVKFVADPPKVIPHPTDPNLTTRDSRTKWLLFGYQVDVVATDCVFVGKEAREHDVYLHGFASKGALFQRCDFQSAGAECLKFRPDITETAYIPGTWIIVQGCKFKDWFQDWSDRGGAAIVLQNANSNVLIEASVFKPGKETERHLVKWNNLSHCIEIASEANGYTSEEGGQKFGNEHVWIRSCAISGRSDVAHQNTVLRVSKNSGELAAKSVTIEASGIYGKGTFVQVTNVPTGKTVIRGCNTPGIALLLKRIGIDVSAQSQFPTASRLVPISEGISR